MGLFKFWSEEESLTMGCADQTGYVYLLTNRGNREDPLALRPQDDPSLHERNLERSIISRQVCCWFSVGEVKKIEKYKIIVAQLHTFVCVRKV